MYVIRIKKRRLYCYFYNFFMDSQPNQPHTFCTKCNNYVRTNNFLIHQQRCRGPVSYANQSSPSRIFSSSRLSNRSSSRRQPTQVNQQRIPCPFCGYGQTLAQLDTHPNNCEHRQQQCQRCHNKFPRSLMNQHRYVCTANQQAQNSEPEESEESESQHFYHGMHMHNQPLRLNFGRRNGPQHMIQFMFNAFSSPSMQRRPSHNVNNRGPERAILINNLGQLIRLLAGGSLHEEHGMKKEEIKQFPTKKFNSKQKREGDQDMCIICYCNFQQDQNYMTLPCKHIFHPQCIGTWLQKNPTCPVCKKNFGHKEQQNQDQSQSDFSQRPPPRMFQFFRSM